MTQGRVDDLVAHLRRTPIDRRRFVRQASALGVSVGAAGMPVSRVVAQATPGASPTASPVAIDSVAPIGRDELLARVHAEFDLARPEVTGGRVVYGGTSDIGTLNAFIAGDTVSWRVSGWIFEGLVGLDPVDGGYAPGLADTWEVAPDGRTYTFHLHPGVRWHDGTPFTSADVVFSYDAMFDERTLSPVRANVVEYLESYRALDELTVELVAKDVFATFIDNAVGLVTIAPRHIWERVPLAEWGADPGSTGQDPSRVVGTGPARFVEWVAGDHVTIRRNPDYWNAPWRWNIDEWVYRVLPETSAATQALLAGEIDVTDITFADAPALTDDPDIALTRFDTSAVGFYAANQDAARTELFLDARVRQALMYALDRTLIAEQIYNGYAMKADGTQPSLCIAYRPERLNTIYDLDPQKARRLLDEAGWFVGDGGVRERDDVRLQFECLYVAGAAHLDQMLPYMQEAWAAVGIQMQPAAMPFPSILDATDTGDFQMALYGFGWGGQANQQAMFGCEYTPPHGYNAMRYCNPRYDELCSQADRTLPRDGEERIDLLVEASNIVNDEQAAGYLVFREEIVGSRNTLHNFYPNSSDTWWSLPWVWTEVR